MMIEILGLLLAVVGTGVMLVLVYNLREVIAVRKAWWMFGALCCACGGLLILSTMSFVG